MANKYLSASLGTGLWTDSTGTWVTTDGGSTPTTPPAVADNVYLTANAGARILTLDGTPQCANIITTGFIGTIAGSAPILVRGDTNWSGNFTLSYTGTWTLGSTTASGIFTTGGKTLPGNLTIGGTGSRTIVGNVTVQGMYTQGVNCTMTGVAYNIYCQGGFTGTGYIANNVNAPKFHLQGGLITGTLPNTQNGCYLDGQTSGGLIFATNVGVREGTVLRYVAGSYPPDVTTNNSLLTTVAMSAGNVFELGADCPLNNVQWGAGTHFLQADVYTASSQSVTANPTFSGAYKVYVSKDHIMYGVCTGTGTGGFLGFELIGTGKFCGTTTVQGSTLSNTVNIVYPVIINTSGTITFEPKSVNFSGNNTLTHTNGTIASTGFTMLANGYNLDMPNKTLSKVINSGTMNIVNNMTITDFTGETGSTTNAPNGLVAPIFRMNGSAVYNEPNNASVLDIDSIIVNGTDTLSPTIQASPIFVSDFVNSIPTYIDGNDTKISSTKWSAQQTFTQAFDYTYIGYTGVAILGQGDGYVWHPQSYPYRFYYFMSASDAYYFNHGMSIGQKYRVVFSKASGTVMKCWVNGVPKSAGINGTSANLINGDVAFDRMTKQAEGDTLFFQTEVDQAWVDADYAKFLAGGNSTNMQYDASEPNLVAGWHVDSWTDEVRSMNLKYNGTTVSEQINKGTFKYVNASQSASPLFDWNGTVTNCQNIYAVNAYDIGGAGIVLQN